jgi:hypothetical protein
MNPTQINCAEACVNGCVLGDAQCPNKEHREKASRFIQETSLDQMLAIAEESLRRRTATSQPKWVFPEDGINPNQ